jgi:thymidylate synthase (FAD)
MKIIRPGFVVEDKIDGEEMLRKIEAAGRTCYKSEERITSQSARVFVRNLIARGHESVLEHEKVTVRIFCDRGVSHEIVRHRIASYSQESTRYCNYGGSVTYISPDFLLSPEDRMVLDLLERHYTKRLAEGLTPQQARYFLPNGLKTEIVCTFNLREWRHFFRLRTASAAHPQMRQITLPMLEWFKDAIPVVFDDINVP